MSTISSYSGYTTSLADILNNLNSDSSDSTSTDDYWSSLASSTSTTINSSTAGSTLAATRAKIEDLLADVPKGSDGKLSFQDVIDYRNTQRDDLKSQVMSDLSKLGVDTSQDINLSYDSSSNTVNVTNNPTDKDLIERYFKANPDVVSQYAKLQDISNLTAAAENKTSASDLTKQFQAQSLQSWFSDNTDSDLFSTSMYMNISNSTQATLLSGLNLTV